MCGRVCVSDGIVGVGDVKDAVYDTHGPDSNASCASVADVTMSEVEDNPIFASHGLELNTFK